jgi:hypothetical protein
MTQQLDAVLEREMSRREFLSILGLGLASILGFSTIVRLLSGKSLDHHFQGPSLSGYSNGAYGGGKE